MTPRKELSPDDTFHPDTKEEGSAVAFFSVEGTASVPWYDAVILGRNSRGKALTAEFRGETAGDLVARMNEAGWETLSVTEVARLCESAGRSQRIVNDRRFAASAEPTP